MLYPQSRHSPRTIPSFPPPIPSFPQKRESTPRPIVTPGYTGVLDSGLRRNDGAAAGIGGFSPGLAYGGGGESPQPPFCERGAFG